MNRDRRLLARKRPAEFGFIQIDHDEGGRILNISEGGLCFETFAPIEQERLLRFWFSLNLRERVEASGRLTWIDQRRKVGGLQFLDLSPRGRKHLRAHLGAEPIRVAGRLQSEDPPAKGGAFLAALAKQSMDGPAPQPPTRGNTFLAALAKQSMDGLALQPPVRQGPAIQTPAIRDRATQAWNPAEQDFERNAELERGGTADRSETRFSSRNDSANATAFVPFERQRSELERAGAAAQSETQIAFENGSANGTAFVPFERHRTNGRRKFLGGVVLGSVLSLAVGAAGGWFLAQQQPLRGRAPASPSAAPATASAPVTPVGSVGTGGPGTSNAPGAAGSVPANTSAPTGRSTSADHATGTKASTPSALSPQAAETHGAGLTPVRESETPAGKKPRRTLKQLWAAVQAGNANAAVELADHYIQGDGVLVNCDQARILLLVASEKNNAEAIKKLRDLDRTGCGAQGASK